MVTIFVNDLEVSALPVKLHVKMETAGVTIGNPVTINTTPIFLDGGSALVLLGQDLIANEFQKLVDEIILELDIL